MEITGLITALVIGLVTGARLLAPRMQNIPIRLTMLVGVATSPRNGAGVRRTSGHHPPHRLDRTSSGGTRRRRGLRRGRHLRPAMRPSLTSGEVIPR
jgi:hypothetical protein